jgi:hypothetical protein
VEQAVRQGRFLFEIQDLCTDRGVRRHRRASPQVVRPRHIDGLV